MMYNIITTALAVPTIAMAAWVIGSYILDRRWEQ